MNAQFTYREHFVPTFLLRYFADDSGLISVIDKQTNPISARNQSPKNMMVINDMYETKNGDGTYFERNVIENLFAKMEGHISTIIEEFKRNANETLILSENDDSAIALLVALQLVRLPFIKTILTNSPKGEFTSDEEKALYDNAMYRMLLYSDESAFAYLEKNGLALSDWAKGEVTGKNLLSHIASFILSECAVYLVKTKPDSHFIITDNPVLIDAFPDAKYTFPISPNLAVCCCLWNQAKGNQDGGCIEINTEGVKKINKLLFEKANRWVVCRRTDTSVILSQLS